jgi:hypothetical protein
LVGKNQVKGLLKDVGVDGRLMGLLKWSLIKREYVDWIHLAQVWFQRRDILNTVFISVFHKRQGIS